MPRRKKQEPVRVKYNLVSMENAIALVKGGHSIRNAAAEAGVPVSTLGKHYKEPKLRIGGGRKCELGEEEEKTLTKYLLQCGIYGYGYTKREVKDFVSEFIKETGIETRWGEKGPGDEWFALFLQRHPELSIRKGECLGSQRVRGADPFIIKKWYDNLNDLFIKEGITSDNANLVYNCDESGFGHDPKDVKLLAPKGMKRVSKNVAGSGKKNTTVLACACADGTKMPPFIIFAGKYVWSSWMCQDPYPGTAYTAQERGWMEGNIFNQWFETVFLKHIPPKENRTKKVILIYDGLASHTSYKLAKMAVDNNVVLVKLPANMTHYMQPLDKTVFKPLKTYWNKLMIDYNRQNPGKLLPNSDFAHNIKLVWENAFKSDNIISGFLSTGIFPTVNWLKVPKTAYDPIKLERFEKNTLSFASCPSQPIETPSACNSGIVPTPCNIDIAEEEHSSPQASTSGTSKFETFIRRKLSENLTKRCEGAKKRMRLSEKVGDILTAEDALETLRLKHEDNKMKKCKKSKIHENTTENQKKKKPEYKCSHISSSSSEDEATIPLASDTESEDFDFHSDNDENDVSVSVEAEPPEIKLGAHYSVYYEEKWYIGKVIDVKDKAKPKLKFMHETMNGFYWPKNEDMQCVDVEFIFYGPISLCDNDTLLKREDRKTINKLYKNMKPGAV